MAEAGEVVLPVRVDDRPRRREFFGRLVMVEHDRVEPQPRGFGQRLVARGAAIDRDQEFRPLPGQRADRLDVRAVALGDAVGDVDQGGRAAGAQVFGQKRGAAGAVHVVIAKNGDRLAPRRRLGEARRRRVHVAQNMRIGHEVAQARG